MVKLGRRIPQPQPDDIRRQVLEMAALGCHSQGAIAKKLAITRSRVQKIIMKAAQPPKTTPIAKRGRPSKVPPELTEFLMNKLKTVDWQPDKEVSLWNEAKRALRLNVGRMMVRRELARLRAQLIAGVDQDDEDDHAEESVEEEVEEGEAAVEPAEVDDHSDDNDPIEPEADASSTDQPETTLISGVRRSARKTSKQIETEQHAALEEAILTACNEKLLEVFTSKEKGRGCRALAGFHRGEFVVEYRGEMLNDLTVAKQKERVYAEDPSIGSYMYFYKHKNRHYCIDATEETAYKGRLVNHSILRPNMKIKVVEVKGGHRLVLVAIRDIAEGEELLYDYGDRTPATVAENPWLVNS